MQANIKATVCTRLVLCRELLTAKSQPDLPVAEAIVISHEATLLALTAMCDQLECLPHHSHAGLPDYLDGLKKVKSFQFDNRDLEFFLGLHKARVDMQNRAILPDGQKWQAVRSATRDRITKLCDQLNIPFDKLQFEENATAPSSSHTFTSPASSKTMLIASPMIPGTPNLGAASEERRYPRFDCTGAIELTGPHSGRPRKGQLLNLSIGGCFAHTDWPLDVGTRVEIRLELTGVCFRALGEVRMVDSRGGMGIEFAAMSNRARQRLGELITELGEATERQATGPRPQQPAGHKRTP